MRKTIVVAVREYQAAVKTKAFILSVVLMPVLIGGSIVVRNVLEDKVDTNDKRFAIADLTGHLYDGIATKADERNRTKIFDGEGEDRTQVKPRFLIERTEADGDRADICLGLSERVRQKEIYGFVIVGDHAVKPGDDADRAAITYHSNSPTYRDFMSWVSVELNDAIRALRFEAANLDPAIVREATQRVPIGNLGLVSMDESGAITDAKETNRIVSLLLPMGMMMLMFMVIFIGAQPMMQGVLEEKMQRIAEVLLGSVSPFELMMGKLLGTVGVALTITTIYLAGAFVAIHKAGYGEFFPTTMIWWFIIFQILAILLYGSLFAAIGAAVSDMKEAQSMLTPVSLLIVAPMFVWMPVAKEPLSTFSTAVSLFPPATPMLMVLRQAVPPGVPIWQPLLGIVLVLLTTIFTVYVSGRIFRVGILMQGKGASFTDMFRWALRG